jgi:pSer/pThr/pTyr-binding forkhead associated (FHA) protein
MPMSKLFLVRYPDEPLLVPDKGKTTIGRSDENKIMLPESRVSRKHAEIEWLRFKKSYSITDLGSSNGTYLNSNRLVRGQAQFLNDWDKIRVASAVFTVRIVETPSLIMNEFKELRTREQTAATEIIKIADILSMQNQPALAGDLRHLCPVELFQMLETGHKSGVLTLSANRSEGTFAISDGQVVAAKFNDLTGETAVYETLKFSEGTFSFNPQEVSVEEPEITTSTTFLLMEGCRLLDEAAIAAAGSVREDTVV